MFKVKIARPGGKDASWVELPATGEQLLAAMKQARIDSPKAAHSVVLSCSGISATLAERLGEHPNLEKPNFFAGRLAALDDHQIRKLETVCKAVPAYGDPGYLARLINLTYNLDCWLLIDGIHTPEQLGEYYIFHSGVCQMPDSWKYSVPLCEFGERVAKTENGRFTEYGYLMRTGDEYKEHFTGRTVPQKYRVPEADRERQKPKQRHER
ncbi:antirestriction protein ArdA [Anaerotruncus rubiinfantis]|uniref:antirestriction protein ArdA n=1 Tax=Anaerotruncus rubiinfantis TaxID=1720200 RepID=UPI0011C9E230|nr:antirestriction protein ArdA [Anaerotruncus rubiinfantis]